MEVDSDAGGDVIAIDVGGTVLKGARCTAGGAPAVLRRATPSDPAAAVTAVRELAAALRGPRTAAAGVVTPGIVDAAAGVVRYAANLGWRDVPLRRLLEADLGLPVALEHDVTAAALAELTMTPDDGDLLFVAVGTGIAAAHVLDGRARRGASGPAVELGHIPVHPDGRTCACGQRGCLETYASAAAIAGGYAGVGGDPTLDAAAIAARRGVDALAARVWQEAVEALALGLATATLLLDPHVVVLGGGLSGAGDALVAPLRTALAARLTWRLPPHVRVTALGADAGRRGAALLAWQMAAAATEGCPT